MASVVRNHRKIENSLTWCLDMSFREDENHLRERIAADNLACLGKFLISILCAATIGSRAVRQRTGTGVVSRKAPLSPLFSSFRLPLIDQIFGACSRVRLGSFFPFPPVLDSDLDLQHSASAATEAGTEIAANPARSQKNPSEKCIRSVHLERPRPVLHPRYMR